MNLILSLFRRRNPGRELALLGVRKRRIDSYKQREKVRAIAQSIRKAKGMKPSKALQP